RFDPGLNIDFYALGLIFNGISSTLASINFIATIFKLRAPGMSLNRMPLFIYAILAVSLSLIFALPPLTIDLVFLELQRRLSFHFFDVGHGGSALLWQHLFWFFGHPEVYIIVLPAFGIATSIIPTFAKHRMVAFPLVALAELLVAFIGFGVWAHHMFATGLPTLTLVFFAAASMMVVIPSTIQVFAWTSTVMLGKPDFKTPLLVVGLLGMPRRVYTYQPHLGWDAYNLSETIGAFILTAGLLTIFGNLVWSRFRGLPSGPDPFYGGTLEWTTTSPPPHYNFAVIPT